MGSVFSGIMQRLALNSPQQAAVSPVQHPEPQVVAEPAALVYDQPAPAQSPPQPMFARQEHPIFLPQVDPGYRAVAEEYCAVVGATAHVRYCMPRTLTNFKREIAVTACNLRAGMTEFAWVRAMCPDLLFFDDTGRVCVHWNLLSDEHLAHLCKSSERLLCPGEYAFFSIDDKNVEVAADYVVFAAPSIATFTDAGTPTFSYSDIPTDVLARIVSRWTAPPRLPTETRAAIKQCLERVAGPERILQIVSDDMPEVVRDNEIFWQFLPDSAFHLFDGYVKGRVSGFIDALRTVDAKNGGNKVMDSLKMADPDVVGFEGNVSVVDLDKINDGLLNHCALALADAHANTFCTSAASSPVGSPGVVEPRPVPLRNRRRALQRSNSPDTASISDSPAGRRRVGVVDYCKERVVV